MKDLQRLTVPGVQAIAALDRLRAEFKTTGLYPILLGGPEDVEIIEDWRSDADDRDEILVASTEIDPVTWLRDRGAEDPETYNIPTGTWPSAAELANLDDTAIVTHLNWETEQPFTNVEFALLPLREPWEAFAWLGWGDWNGCPTPAEHCALHHYWAKQYGAEVVSLTGSVVQCVVSRPATSQPQALALAGEQFIYAPDLVLQGTETIAALAADLQNQHVWYFWWD